jgi:hypothetical protein
MKAPNDTDCLARQNSDFAREHRCQKTLSTTGDWPSRVSPRGCLECLLVQLHPSDLF